jgi:hypothetical protein
MFASIFTIFSFVLFYPVASLMALLGGLGLWALVKGVSLPKLLFLVGMAINNTVANNSPGFGSPQLIQRLGIALSGAAQQTTSVPATGAIVPGIYQGKVRVKVYAGTGTGVTLTDLVLQITDGTNTVIFGEFHPNSAPTLTATTWVDVEFDFTVDFGGTPGGASGQLIAPGAATAAAIVVQVLTTLGVPGGATMDIEVIGQP